jgi:hypothetical protein
MSARHKSDDGCGKTEVFKMGADVEYCYFEFEIDDSIGGDDVIRVPA